MDFGKRVIVGVKGTKGSGKDTVADICAKFPLYA